MIYALVGIAGLLLGIVIGALAGSRKSKVALAVAQQRLADLAQQLAAEKVQTQSLRDSLADSERNLAAARTQFAAAERNLVEQRELIGQAQEQLRLAFSSASAEALARNNEAFLQLAKERFATISAEAVGSLDKRKEQIDAMLKPLRELMDQYQLRVGEIEKSRVESYSMLREQLGTLAETQRTLNTQTSQLVTALSRPTVRGQWGEISLRRLVELAGLSNKCDFVEQGIVDGEQGRLKPDMVVNLPGQRDVVIDCKTALDAFLDAAAATDEDARRSHLQRHAQQVRSRARELSGKSYWSQFSRSPEYVIMFLPGEPFLYAAVEQDPSLVEDCIRNHVLLATPTTLIALLKTIEFGWRQEAISENAEQIRSLGVELYERLGTILGHIAKLGSNLSSAVASYNQTIGSLESRVLPTTRKMAELGAHTGKELPRPELIERLPREIPALTSESPP
jgi:DNA recombination protein RmuC